MASLTAWWIGDQSQLEWAETLAWLRARGPLACFTSITAALAEAKNPNASPPSWLFLAAPRPGCLPAAAVAQLTTAYPLARAVAILGSWSEGEARSGTPWPGVLRVYWHQAVARLTAEMAQDGRETWSLPRTASDADRAFHRSRTAHVPPHAGLLAIGTSARRDYEVWADVARATGYASVWVAAGAAVPPGHWTAGLFDGDLFDGDLQREATVAHLRAFVAGLHPAPVLCLLDFPRRQDAALVRQCGAAGLLAKPLVLSDLLALLQTCCSANGALQSPYPNSIPA